jgi:hypothetical protein
MRFQRRLPNDTATLLLLACVLAGSCDLRPRPTEMGSYTGRARRSCNPAA